MSTERTADIRLLSRALDQVGDVLTRVRAENLADPTPCRDWSLGQLIDHVVADCRNFRSMLLGEQIDWAGAPEHVREGWAETFREAGDDLVHEWHQLGDEESPVDPGMQIAEFAVHTWDLATAIGFSTRGLDPDVAVRSRDFLAENLTEANRGDVFAPAQPVPDGAGPYQELAALAGREV